MRRIKLTIVLAILAGSFVSGQNKAVENGLQQLLVRNTLNSFESIYLQTDREVYAPADTLWFKAYVRDRINLQPSSLSQTLHVQLADADGNVVETAMCLVSSSGARGQFTLGHNLGEGRYYLLAYTSWLQNFSPGKIYKKEIHVRKEKRDDMQLMLSLDRSRYYPGDSLRAVVRCLDPLNREVEGVRVRYMLDAGQESQERNTGRIRSGSPADTLRLLIPEEMGRRPLLTIEARQGGQVMDTSFFIPVLRNIHLDFMPEGGHGLLGQASVMAFKAQSMEGEPIGITGELLNKAGQVLAPICSSHDGMGSFDWTPAPEGELLFRITDPPGFDSLRVLPGGLEQGLSLGGRVEEQQIRLSIGHRETPSDSILVTLTIRDQLHFVKQVDAEEQSELLVPRDNLPCGIAVVTLFDMQMRPRAERLFYLGSPMDGGLYMETGYRQFMPRDRVRLNIRPSDAGLGSWKGDYSLSVVDHELCLSEELDEPNIRTSFLLSPEIRGRIHRPNYYMNTDDPEVLAHLDLLLLTQGWRDYSLLSDTGHFSEASLPVNQDVIRGTLMKQPFGKLPRPAAGEINLYYGGNNSTVAVDENGRFQLAPEYDMAYNSGILISGTVNGSSGNVVLDIEQSQFEKDYPRYRNLLCDSLAREQWEMGTGGLFADRFNLGIAYHEWIEEVAVYKAARAPMNEDLEIRIEEFTHDNKEARKENIESAVDILDILYNMGLLVEYLPDSDLVEYKSFPKSPIGWVVDDSYYGTAYSLVQSFVPRSIESFVLVRGTQTKLFGANMPEVVVSIRTRTYDPADPDNPMDKSKYLIPPYSVERKFYRPLYDTEEKRNSTLPDFRKTIHWEPDLEVDQKGEATVVFFNGDRYTRITCILEGISDRGVPVYREFSYRIGMGRE